MFLATDTLITPTHKPTEAHHDGHSNATTSGHTEHQNATVPTTRGTEAHTTVTAAPTTVETATSRYHSAYHNQVCNFTACVEPHCQCLNDKPPKGLLSESIPQFVTITFDGAVTVTNFPSYKDLFASKNPNGCPLTATYFVSHVDTNYKLVHELHRRGNEIGVHSIR